MIANRSSVVSRASLASHTTAGSGRSRRRGRKAALPVIAAASDSPTNSFSLSRRRTLLSSLATVAVTSSSLFPVRPASAQIAQRNTFTIDALPPFDIDVPSSWTFSDTEVSGAVANRPTRVYFPRDDPLLAPADANVSLVVTVVGADFTSLGSFGDAEAFGSSLVSSMDRGFAGGPSARLVSAKKVLRERRNKSSGSCGGGGCDVVDADSTSTTTSRRFDDKPQEAYEIEYAVRRSKDEGERLFVSAVALSFDGRYNRLYTITGQVAAGEAAEKYGKEVETIVKSFVPPATRV